MEERTNAVELRVARAVQAHKELVDAHGRDAAVLRALTALFVVFAVVESQAPSWAARLFFLGVFLAAVYWVDNHSAASRPSDASTEAPRVEMRVTEPAAAVVVDRDDENNVRTTMATTPARTSSAVLLPVSSDSTAATRTSPPTSPYTSKDTWGCLGHLDAAQTAALAQMHAHFDTAHCRDPAIDLKDDRLLLRFLRARKFDVDKARRMLEHHVEWGDKYLPSTVTAEDVKAILPCGLARPGPFTKEGLPIIMIKVEHYDPAQFHDVDLFVRYCAYNFYVVVRRLPPGAEKGVLFFDMRGWSLWKHANAHSMKLVGILIKIIQDQNPERLQKAVLFNAPAIFSATWKLIKVLLDPVVAAKVVFVNDVDTVLQMVHASDLPKEYGGERTEPYPIVAE